MPHRSSNVITTLYKNKKKQKQNKKENQITKKITKKSKRKLQSSTRRSSRLPKPPHLPPRQKKKKKQKQHLLACCCALKLRPINIKLFSYRPLPSALLLELSAMKLFLSPGSAFNKQGLQSPLCK